MTAASTDAMLEMHPTTCLFCGAGSAVRELFPACLTAESFTAYAFSARRERKREHYRIVSCASCGLIRSDPVVDATALERLYQGSEFLSNAEAPFAAHSYRLLLEALLRRHGDAQGVTRLLEIGCSNGFFLEEALKMGIPHLLGFEPSASCRDHAPPAVRESIRTEPFTAEALHDGVFDLVCSFHVIDHLHDPLAVLKEAAVRDGGFTLLVCHDVASLSARLLGERSPIFDVEHIYLFSRDTLRLLLEHAGFEALEVGSLANTYPLGYWMRLMPELHGLLTLLPETVKRLPVRLRAGNLYAFGRKRGNRPC